MKKLSLLITTVLLLAVGCVNAQTAGSYKVQSIDSTKNYYLINLTSVNNKDTLLLISERYKGKYQKGLIQIDKTYALVLERYFSKKQLDKFPPSPNGMSLKFDNRSVKISYSSVPYKTKSLKGLMFIN